jgi:peptidoglycan/LPS O-acetylase OafA/YrhL
VTTPPVPEQREWLPLIEALRAIAALSVAAHHVKDLGGIQPFTGSWLLDGMGQWGVLLFFMLSGFLLCESFWGTRSRADLGAFYIRRIARIAPAYYVTAGLLFLFFAPHALLFSNNGLKQTIASATFTHWFWPQYSSSFNVDGALWTLSIEMALYASLPLLAWLIGRWPVVATAGLIVSTVAWHLVVALLGQHFVHVWFTHSAHVPEGIVRIYMARQFPGFLGVFALGIVLRRWLLLRRGRLHAHVVRPVQHHGVLWLLVLLAPSLAFLRFTARSSDFHHWIWFSSFDLVIAVLLLPPLAHAARHVNERPRLSLTFLQWLGQRSYSV